MRGVEKVEKLQVESISYIPLLQEHLISAGGQQQNGGGCYDALRGYLQQSLGRIFNIP